MKTRSAWMLLAGLLALASRAQADIVWSGVQNLSVGFQYVDLNFDSITDASISYEVTGDPSVESARIAVYVDTPFLDGSNRILLRTTNWYMNAALPMDTLISGNPDPSLAWEGGLWAGGSLGAWTIFNPDYPGPPLVSDEEWRGPLGEDGNTYIGIEFDIAGTNHYGWVNIALGEEGYMGFRDPVVASWAYESTPNTAIAAGAVPEPSTGLLTVGGSVALLCLARARRRGRWRRG